MITTVPVASGSALLVGLLLASAPCQANSAHGSAPIGSQTQRARELIKSDQKMNALEILDVKFDPIHQGKNLVRVKVKNTTEQRQVFGIHIQAQSRFSGFGRQFIDRLKAHETKWTRFEFELTGPITDATWIRLQYYNPASEEQRGFRKWFRQVRYAGGDLEHRNSEQDRQRPATESQKQAVTKALQHFRNHAKRKEYDAAWKLLGEKFRSTMDRGKFKQAVDVYLPGQSGFFDFRVDSVVEHFGYLRMEGVHDDGNWVIDFIEKDGQYIINTMRSIKNRGDWKQRLLPKMQKRSTPHFDIHYAKGSTADREIDQIVKRREQGFREICSFLGKESDVRICLVLFENAEVKRAETGHQGAGWAFGRTIVEVYNKQQKLDPYHETVHILTPPHGNPPALFNEGLAVYMAERLGTNALALIGSGQASICERARELRSKGEWIPLRELLSYTEIGPGWSRPKVAYPEAASFVKFLMDEYGREKFLEAFKTLENSPDGAIHLKNVVALERIYDEPLADLREQWLAVIAGLD